MSHCAPIPNLLVVLLCVVKVRFTEPPFSHSIVSHGFPLIPVHVVHSTVPAGKAPGSFHVAEEDPPTFRQVCALSAMTVPSSRYFA